MPLGLELLLYSNVNYEPVQGNGSSVDRSANNVEETSLPVQSTDSDGAGGVEPTVSLDPLVLNALFGSFDVIVMRKGSQ